MLKDQNNRLVYEKKDGSTFCQLQIWPAQRGSADAEANFKTDWEHFAGKPYNITDPAQKQTQTLNGWTVITGVGLASFEGIQFIVSVSTFSQGNVSWCIITQFNDEKYTTDIDNLLLTIKADKKKFAGKENPAVKTPGGEITNTSLAISKPTTNFDDGWVARALSDYVELKRQGTEIRLHYIDKTLDDARSNTTGVPEYYWAKYITPFFNVSNPQKWSGVEYPIIYFMEGNAVDKRTGKSCYVAIKIVFSGGARPVVVIAPNQASYQQQFRHPDDVNRMLNYNKFAVTAKDIAGKWSGSGGGGADYYSIYTGDYVGSHTLSTSDEFIFNTNGTYSSKYRSANINGGNAQFGGQDFKGNFTVSDWQVTATNRFGGKTTAFIAQLIAVKGGYLLYLEDPDYRASNYTLYKTK